MKSKSPNIAICGLYPRRGSAGDQIYHGITKDGRELLLIPNRYKRNDRDPQLMLLAIGEEPLQLALPAPEQSSGIRHPLTGDLVGSPNEDANASNRTGLEAAVRRALIEVGLPFIEQAGGLPGTPDFFIPRARTAVFVHGCTWHDHDCDFAEPYGTRAAANRMRDARVEETLLDYGFRIAIIWGCSLIGERTLPLDEIAFRLLEFIESDAPRLEIGDERSTRSRH